MIAVLSITLVTGQERGIIVRAVTNSIAVGLAAVVAWTGFVGPASAAASAVTSGGNDVAEAFTARWRDTLTSSLFASTTIQTARVTDAAGSASATLVHANNGLEYTVNGKTTRCIDTYPDGQGTDVADDGSSLSVNIDFTEVTTRCWIRRQGHGWVTVPKKRTVLVRSNAIMAASAVSARITDGNAVDRDTVEAEDNGSDTLTLRFVNDAGVRVVSTLTMAADTPVDRFVMHEHVVTDGTDAVTVMRVPRQPTVLTVPRVGPRR